MFDLYVDPMVDNIPDKIRDVLGFRPADEKLLGIVFEKGQFVEMEEFEVKIRTSNCRCTACNQTHIIA